MAEIVNLRRARKQRKREDDAVRADANRIAFGRSKQERSVAEKEQDLAARRLDGHRRESADE